MLRREDERRPMPPAAQQRVTPEELAHALAILEARKQQEQAAAPGTLSIGQAVEELALDLTPEEIWDEIQAQRGAEEDDPPVKEEMPQEDRPWDEPPLFVSAWRLHRPAHESLEPATAVEPFVRRVPAAWYVAAVLLIPLLGMLALMSGTATNTMPRTPIVVSPLPYVPPRVDPPMLAQPQVMVQPPDAGFLKKLAQCIGPHPAYCIVATNQGATPFQPVPLASEGAAYYPERAIPDGYSIYRLQLSNELWSEIGAVTFVPRAALMPPASVHDDFFITTRYAGRLYVRGWVSQRDVEAVREGGPFTLHRDNHFAHAVCLTLPLQFGKSVVGDRLRKALTDNDQSLYPVVNVPNQTIVPGGTGLEIDSHAWGDFTQKAVLGSSAALKALPADLFTVCLPVLRSQRSFSWAVNPDFDASSVLCRIKDLPEGHPFRASYATLISLAQGNAVAYSSMDAEEDGLVDIRPEWWRPWTIVKKQGLLYIRGWIAPGANGQAPSYPARLFIHPGSTESGAKLIPTLISLEGSTLSLDSQPRDDGSLIVENAHFDNWGQARTLTSGAIQAGSENGNAQP